MKKIILLHIILISALSCKKIESNLEGNKSNDPIYLVGGDINGAPFNLIVNDTNIVVDQGTKMMNGIKTYYSEISNSTDNESIKILFAPAERPSQKIADYDTDDQYLSFLVHETKCFKFNFIHDASLNSSFSYYDSNNQLINSNEISFDEYGLYPVSYKINGVSTETYSTVINNGFEGKDLDPDFSLVEGTVDDLEVLADNTDHKHDWYLNGNHISSASYHVFNEENGIFTMRHVITDEHGNSMEKTKLFSLTSHVFDWILDIEYCQNNQEVTNFDKIIVEYEKDGELYSSAYTKDNLSHEILMTNLEYFTEGGAIAVKATLNFNCRLANSTQSKYLDLSNIKGTFKYHL